MKNLKLVDWIIIATIIIALIVGVFTFAHIRQTASNQIEATSKIGFQVVLRGVTLTGNKSPIVPGEKTFITIRNVPYTDLDVIDVKIDTKKVVMPNPSKTKEKFVIVEDYSQIFLYDMVVTLVDTAKITKDGAVVGGNKVKIGLPVTLEGKNYKLNGIVSDIQILPEVKEPSQNDVMKKPIDIKKQENNMG